MRFQWDPEKDEANRRRHGIGFVHASELFRSGVDCLEMYDDEHSDAEERFIAIGPTSRGLLVVVWTERDAETVRIISARKATRRETELFREHFGEKP